MGNRQTVLALSAAALLIFAAPTAHAEWLQSDTEHFTIIYEPDDEAVATELAGFADDVYQELRDYLGIRVDRQMTRRLPVVIRGETADANGYFTLLPTRIVIYSAVPSTPILHPNLDEWLRLVFVHELTHFFQIAERNGWGAASVVLGPSARLLNLVFMPRWLAEGISIHAETQFSAGGRGRSPVFEMQYMAAVLADEFWSLDQNNYGSDFAPRSRPYVGGHVIVDYIIRTYGIDLFMELSRAYLRHPILGIRRAVRRTLPVTADELYDAILAELEDALQSRPAVASGELVSPEGPGYWFLVRGSDAIYGSAVSSYSRLLPAELWKDGVEAGEMRRALHMVVDPYSLAISGQTIVGIGSFAETWSPGPWSGHTDLVTIDAQSGTARRVTEGRRLYHSAIAPDASFAVAVERAGAYSRLVEVALDSGEVTALWEPAATYMSAPAVSPDGGRVVLIAGRDGEQDLYLLDRQSGAVHRLTRSPGVAEYFPLYVDPDTIWFTANLNGPLALYELDLQSGEVVRRLSDANGVYYATPLDGGAVYASYSVTGPSVKRAAALEGAGVEWPGGVVGAPTALASAAGSSEGADRLRATARRHLDWPIPELWLPFALPGRSEGGFALDAGAVVFAGSVREHNLVSLAAAINTASLVPTINLDWAHFAGPWQLQVIASTGPVYTQPTGLESRLLSSGTIGVGRTIARWQGLRQTHVVGASLAASLVSRSAAGVTLADQLAGPSEENVDLLAGLQYELSRERRRTDFYGPAGLTVTATGEGSLGLDPDFPLVPGVRGTIGGRLPVGSAMMEATFSAATRTSSASIGVPGGLRLPLYGEPPLTPRSPAVIGELGVESPALLLDAAFRWLHITQLAARGYVQQAIDYGAASMGLRPETSIGVEIAARVGLLSAPFAPAIGFVATVPHADPTSFRLGLTLRNVDALPGIAIGTVTP